MAESQIPVGTQFSPDLVDLKAFAQAVVRHSGDRAAILESVGAPPVRTRPYKTDPTRRMRSLPVEAGIQYGLITEDGEATDLARRLAELEGPEMYEAFARHILLHLGGLRVVQGIEEMLSDGLAVGGDPLARYLTDQGFFVAEHNTAINTLRMWLARAGLFAAKGGQAWVPNRAVKERLLGLNDETIMALAGFTPPQIAFTKALARRAPEGWIQASVVRDLAEAEGGVRIDRGSLPNAVLSALAGAGLIEYETAGTSSGKSTRLRTNDTFKSEVLQPFLDHTLATLDPALTAYYLTRPADIFASLDAVDKNEKGKALEAFAVYVMRLLGLRFMGWRKRSDATGQSEVDVLMSGLFGVVPTTWQVQCKNTPAGTVRLEDVAKEIGIAPLTRATHILIVANAAISKDARRFADSIVQETALTIFLLDKSDFAAIREEPAMLARILKDQASRVRDLKIATPVWREGDARDRGSGDPGLRVG